MTFNLLTSVYFALDFVPMKTPYVSSNLLIIELGLVVIGNAPFIIVYEVEFLFFLAKCIFRCGMPGLTSIV